MGVTFISFIIIELFSGSRRGDLMIMPRICPYGSKKVERWGFHMRYCFCTSIGYCRILKNIEISPPFFDITSKIMPKRVKLGWTELL